jgi:hypothetical protein
MKKTAASSGHPAGPYVNEDDITFAMCGYEKN